jgi:DNA modification methylase
MTIKKPGRCFVQDIMKGEWGGVVRKKGYKLAESQNSKFDEGTQKALGCYASAGAVLERGQGGATGTSIFDPVLCELIYRWFCPPGGLILDPFAGESSKGVVAAVLGYQYVGVELRPEQVEANEAQAAKIKVTPKWYCGDSANLKNIVPPDLQADLIFTSPPYYDLEIYSDSEKDGSAFETYEKFMVWYKDIFAQAIEKLKDNRFLVVKIGEIRDRKTGLYRNFVGDNISCFMSLGLGYYNEAILVTACGSLPIRVGKQFGLYRKLGKTHQNILVFYKGNPKNIKDHFSQEVEFGEAVPCCFTTGHTEPEGNQGEGDS